jgi:rare lipoprotein A
MPRTRKHIVRLILAGGLACLGAGTSLASMTGGSAIVVASWYGPSFHGRRTASGQVFDQERLTAAHKTLPFGTKLRVTNLRNGRSVLVTVNDRGPFVRNRQLDLSLGAARRLGIIRPGTAPVLMEKL